MQLHQLLRFITTDVPIVLIGLNHKRLYNCLSKKDIPLEYYEDDIFLISSGVYDEEYNRVAIYIMLQK